MSAPFYIYLIVHAVCSIIAAAVVLFYSLNTIPRMKRKLREVMWTLYHVTCAIILGPLGVFIIVGFFAYLHWAYLHPKDDN